jgi:hypothetical protein
MTKKEIFFIILGSLFILIGIGANEWLLGSLTSDGVIDSSSQLFLIRFFDIAMVLMGVGIILLRKSSLLPKLIASAVIMVVMFLALDILLYLSAPMLPENLVLAMSPSAQVRYVRGNAASLPWIYDEYIRYARPDTEVELFGHYTTADALGYRNPADYLTDSPEIEVVTMGDSFIWGTEDATIADYLRQMATPHTVYNLGMAGDGVPQWQYHYQRFIENTPAREAPKLVVLNFYSGNDITDTQVFTGLLAAQGEINSADYFAHLNHQYMVPKSGGGFSLPKLPEFLFLTNFSMDSFKNRGAPVQELAEGEKPVCLKHREPYPEQLKGQTLEQIALVVEAIHNVDPDTQVLLSYLPTSAGIYGDQMLECPDYTGDIQRQKENSQVLGDFAEQLGIHYVDVTPSLQEQAQDEVLWAINDHFSPRGYELYSQLLAEEIKKILVE